MVEPIVEPVDKLSPDEIKSLPQDERGRYIESSVLALINANKNRGLTISEIERITQYSKNSLLKHVELLFAKRKINRIPAGRTSIYFPNGRIYQDVEFRDIMYGKGADRRIGMRLLENIDGKYVHIQERELDTNGFLEDIGGILIPVSIIPEVINVLHRFHESVQVVKENS